MEHPLVPRLPVYQLRFSTTHSSRQIHNYTHASVYIQNMCKKNLKTEKQLPTVSMNSVKHCCQIMEVWPRFLSTPRGWRCPGSRRWPSAPRRGLLWGTSRPACGWPSCWGRRTRTGTGQVWSCCTPPPCRRRRTSTSPGSLDKQTHTDT